MHRRFNDPHGEQLYDIMINAQFEYYQHLRNKLIPIFIRETQGLVIDTTHWEYEYLFPSKENKYLSPSEEEKLKNIYRSLSILCHPDKCNFSWANDIFILLNEAYNTKNIDVMQELNNYWTAHKTFENFKIVSEDHGVKAELIHKWRNEFWYRWFVPGSIIREIFIPHYEHEKKLQKENEKLEKENMELNEMIELFRKNHHI